MMWYAVVFEFKENFYLIKKQNKCKLQFWGRIQYYFISLINLNALTKAKANSELCHSRTGSRLLRNIQVF